MSKRIGIIVGSLRKGSLNKQMAAVLMALSPTSLTFTTIEIGDMPLYNQDYDDENAVPAAWSAFRKQVNACDGILFVTPEYNRSVPGALKNAIDVGSRPYGQSVWSGKPGAIMSVSPGAIGGFGANHHLRQSLVFLDMPALQQPEAYIGGAGELFHANGEITNESTKQFLKTFMGTFASWVEKHTSSPGR